MTIKNISSSNTSSVNFNKSEERAPVKKQDVSLKSSVVSAKDKPPFQCLVDLWNWFTNLFASKKVESKAEKDSTLLIKIAQENQTIAKDGKYFVEGEKVKIGKGFNNSYDYSMVNLKNPHRTKPARFDTKIEFAKEDTVEAYLNSDSDKRATVMLNMANAKAPAAGTYLQGAKSQEQELCRRIPNLYPALCLDSVDKKGNYDARRRVLLEGNGALITEGLTIARNKDYSLKDKPVHGVNVISAAALDRSEKKGTLDDAELNAARDKAKAVLMAAADKNYETLILGAWGCGAFNNDPEQMALVFKDLLENEFKDVFKKVIFAIKGDDNYNAFKKTITASKVLFP